MVTDRLAESARTAMVDIVTILLGFSVGASTQAQTFLTLQSLLIFGLGALINGLLAVRCLAALPSFVNAFPPAEVRSAFIKIIETRQFSCHQEVVKVSGAVLGLQIKQAVNYEY